MCRIIFMGWSNWDTSYWITYEEMRTNFPCKPQIFQYKRYHLRWCIQYYLQINQHWKEVIAENDACFTIDSPTKVTEIIALKLATCTLANSHRTSMVSSTLLIYWQQMMASLPSVLSCHCWNLLRRKLIQGIKCCMKFTQNICINFHTK